MACRFRSGRGKGFSSVYHSNIGSQEDRDSMKHTKKALAAGLLTAASIGLADTSHAITYAETGDAGQTLATAQTVPAADLTIDGAFANPSDADLYMLSITAAGSYTFSTINTRTNTSGVDTALSLFSSTGTALLENDDASGTTFDSSLTTTLAVGTYYIGVASSGNEPINSASQVLFVGLGQSGDTTAVRGPATGVNPATLSTFNSNESDTTTFGNYEIGITAPAGAAAPEPSTWATLALGGIASAATFLRRRRAA